MKKIDFKPWNALAYIKETKPNYDNPRLIEAWQVIINNDLHNMLKDEYMKISAQLISEGLCKPNKNKKDPEYCDVCECTPCDCGYGSY